MVTMVSFVQQKDSSHETKILALKWLPLLLSSLGSFSYHMVTDVLPGHIAANPFVQEEIAKIIGSLACVLTDNTVITKLKSDLSFDKSVCESITVICPDCDSDAGNQKGDLFLFICLFPKWPPFLEVFCLIANWPFWQRFQP